MPGEIRGEWGEAGEAGRAIGVGRVTEHYWLQSTFQLHSHPVAVAFLTEEFRVPLYICCMET